jgi:hypothetical protein
VGTDAPRIPTDALNPSKGHLRYPDRCSTSSLRRSRRSKGISMERRGRPMRTSGCPAQTSGRPARTSGCPRDSWGRCAKTRTRFAKSHASLAHFSRCPIHLGSRATDTRSARWKTQRPFARISGRRRCDSGR